MVYGTTVIPYTDHSVFNEDTANYGKDNERLGILSANGTVKIVADNVINKVLEADGTEYTKKANDVIISTDVADKLLNNTAADKDPSTADKLLDISQLQINSKIYQLNNTPSAKYLIETDSRFASLQNFLSSDYLLERVKADPEKVAKRLGDGYFEQQYVMQQIHELTGKAYLSDCGSDMEQFKTLMNNGITVAEAMNLQVGVGLTAEQIAALTSDIVWLVKENINGEDVLVPEVYLANVKTEDLTPDGALIVGGDVEIYAKNDLTNLGTIKADHTIDIHADNLSNLAGHITGDDVNLEAIHNITNQGGSIKANHNISLTADNIINETTTTTTQYKKLQQTTIDNTAIITAGNNLTVNAADTITNKGAILTADKDLTLNAKDVSIETVAQETHVAVTNNKSSAAIHSSQNQQSLLNGENISINADNDVNIKGGLLSSDKTTSIIAGNNVNISAVKDFYSEESSVGSKTGDYYNHNKKFDEQVVGTTIAANENITVSADKDITIKGSDLTSQQGTASLTADNVNIQNETAYHERLHESHESSSGLVSAKTTDIYDYNNENSVSSSNISADSVAIHSTKDTNIQASNVVADNDVNISAGGNLNITSAAQTSESEYVKQVQKSGLLSGGGLGFTIGKEKQRDEYAQQNSEQIGSTVGSLNGNVNLNAQKDANIHGSEIIAAKDINISGADVNIENSNSVYNSQEKHEYEKTGLSVSLGGGAINAVSDAVNHLQRADEVEDSRLAALHGYKAYEDLTDNAKDIQNAVKDPKANLGISVSYGTQKSESHSASTTTIAQGSTLMANGDVNITATDKDIIIQGSTIAGDNIKLNANENIHITASENSNKTTESSSSSTSSIGAILTPSGIGGINISGTKANSHIKQNGTTYNESTVAADKNLDFQSGKDTDIQGGMLSGEKVTGNVGGNLNIESKQDNNTYREDSSSAGLNIGLSGAVSGSANKGNIDSDYHSVTEQSGIYAGKDGFDINVDKNTDLTGGIISSEANPDKNNLSTGTLTFTDVHNEAAYSSANKGININTGADADRKDAGITPNIGMPAQGNAASDTKATISQGTIEIKDKEHQQQDISTLNRDTNDSLNKLGEIFDKQTIEERQELSAMFGEEAYKAVGDLALKNGWAEGSPEKNALHALVGGIMSELAGGDFLSGASGATVNEMIQDKLADTFKNDPAMHQWASALIGGIISKIIWYDSLSGASVAINATKNNYIAHEENLSLIQYMLDFKYGKITKEEFLNEFIYYLALNDSYRTINEEDYFVGFNFNTMSAEEKEQIVNFLKQEGFSYSDIYFTYSFEQYLEKNGINIIHYKNEIYQLSNEITQQKLEENKGFFEQFIYDPYASSKENLQKWLDIAGFTPLSIVSEGTNAVIYLNDGKEDEAAIAAFSAIPGMKYLVLAKGAIKLIPESKTALKFLEEYKTVEYGKQYTKLNRKKVLKPNISYQSAEGYKYITDNKGRISSVEADLKLETSKRNNYAQSHVGGKDRLPDDDGGHLIASIFKGSGNIDNLVPMNSTLNRSDYKKLENIWKKALEAGKKVNVKIEPMYMDKSQRPVSFNIDYTINGKKTSIILKN